jgi:tungstate transport system substrate-binding protein
MRLRSGPDAWRRLLTGLALVAMAITSLGFSSFPTWSREKPFIILASTTSTQNSGLFRHILPLFTEASGIEVRVVAVGTGAAIRNARNGDADVLLVHHKASEEKFVADGFGLERHPLMFNDFIIAGPGADPAGIRGGNSAREAMRAIATTKALFISRGDESGTHKRELELWKHVGIEPRSASGTWYRETGSGRGAALNIAAGMGAHILVDRGTWLSFENRQGLKSLVEGDPGLRNEYGVILVSRDKHPHVKSKEGAAFIAWLRSKDGRAAINGFTVNGQRLFTAIE